MRRGEDGDKQGADPLAARPLMTSGASPSNAMIFSKDWLSLVFFRADALLLVLLLDVLGTPGHELKAPALLAGAEEEAPLLLELEAEGLVGALGFACRHTVCGGEQQVSQSCAETWRPEDSPALASPLSTACKHRPEPVASIQPTPPLFDSPARPAERPESPAWT